MPMLRPLVVSVLVLAAAAFCRAAGPYVKVSGLYSRPGDLSVSSPGAFKASLKNNLGLSGAVGYKFPLLRVEAELQRLRSGTEADESGGTLLAGVTRTTGAVKETAGFANAFVDFPSFFGLAPYAGAGLGYARFSLDDLGRTRNGVPFTQFSGHDSTFGYQGMLGLQFHVFGELTLHAGFRLVKRQDLAVHDVVANARQTLSLGTNRVFELGVALGF